MRRKLARWTAAMLAAILALSFAACTNSETPNPSGPPSGTAGPTDGPEPSGNPEKKTVSLNKRALTLRVGESETLTAAVLPAPAGGEVIWTSDNERVATVLGGKVTAVGIGSAAITASAAGANADTCAVTVVKRPDDVDEETGINLTQIAEAVTSEYAAQDFAAGAGIFALGKSASYDAVNRAVALGDGGYAFTKLNLIAPALKYDYGDKAARPGFCGNSNQYLRFTAGGDGGIWILAVNEAGEMMEVLQPVMLDEGAARYQAALPQAVFGSDMGLVFYNPAPEDAGTVALLQSFAVEDELDPKDAADYFADMYRWTTALDNGFEPFNFNPTLGWSGWSGVSRGDMSGNCVAYLDAFGAALEYQSFESEAARAFDGVGLFAKVKIPAAAKKLTYLVGYVNTPSAYRVRLFDGESFTNLTASSAAVNAEFVAQDAGWQLVPQAYNGTDVYEVAIPEAYRGTEVILAVFGKHNRADSYGMRVNNLAFSEEELTAPPAKSEGVDIDQIREMSAAGPDAETGILPASAFAAGWGAKPQAENWLMTGTVPPVGSEANAAVIAKLTVPAFKYLRLAVNAGAGADVRIRFIDLENNAGKEILPWRAVSGETVLQVTSFDATFTGTVGFVVETRQAEEGTVTLFSVTFAQSGRDEDGYDFTAMGYLPLRPMPEDGVFRFDAAHIGEWAVFTSNDDGNTKGFANEIWLQMQSTTTEGAFSVLAANRTTLPRHTTLTVTAGTIDAGALPSYLRVRALKADGSFVDFAAGGAADGWFDVAAGTLKEDYGWGKIYTTVLSVPEELAGQEVTLVVEYDRERSQIWNVLLEALAFA